MTFIVHIYVRAVRGQSLDRHCINMIYTNKFGNKEELSKKNRLTIKKDTISVSYLYNNENILTLKISQCSLCK